ncbi:3-hydroxyacyl-CoA dehydrogenase NAD-binding domain-containing protein [Gluconacetobacter sacchari]|uniref:3-hydroxyacyl-CoA dehydrogenase NAD-binding domain-containing protein n=1 Tax=Gluconacetobacter sacchari TaxID=92759 RepID=UPI0039B54D04
MKTVQQRGLATAAGTIMALGIDNPPVNALGVAVRRDLMAALEAAMRDPAIVGVVIHGCGATFPPGADIREFGGPVLSPDIHALLALVDEAPKPVAAAMHGTAMGGGLELAMACRLRLAAPSTRLGLPEVDLGLLPGAGGTQRLPRLVGIATALDMMVTGRQIPASDALRLGLIRHVVDTPLPEAAAALLSDALLEGNLPPRVRDCDMPAMADGADDPFELQRALIMRRMGGFKAPSAILACVRAAMSLPFAEGLAFESARFAELLADSQHRAKTHLFFAQRAAARAVPNGVPRPVACVGVVGAGMMGSRIALSFLQAGMPVVLVDRSDAQLDNARALIAAQLDRAAASGVIAASVAAEGQRGLVTATSLSALAGTDLAIEAVFENTDLKSVVLCDMESHMPPHGIVVSNTSTIDVDLLGQRLQRRDLFCGMHFFSPANVMKLVEVVRTSSVSADTLATVMAVARRIGKVAVLAGNCDGFIGNRILRRYAEEGDHLLEEGATPWQIDAVLKAFGLPMGLYLMKDMAGVDIDWQVRQARLARFGAPLDDVGTISDRLYAMGRYGQKSGAGYYRYEGRKALPDPVVEEIIRAVSREKGRPRRVIEDDEIERRILAAMVNEAASILDDGTARAAADIDLVYVHGYGFPSYLGGPMFWSESRGLGHVLDWIDNLQARYGKRWCPAPALVAAVRDGGKWHLPGE